MSKPAACPMCEMNEILEHAERYECVTCGHEWVREAVLETSDSPRVVKDAHGNVLADGDAVVLIKDLKVKGAGQTLKQGTVIKSIRLTGDAQEIDCRHDGIRGLVLRAEFVRKR